MTAQIPHRRLRTTRPAGFGVPAGTFMADPISLPEDPGFGSYAAEPGEADQAEPLWLRLAPELAPYFDLGFCHTEDTCPCVVLRVRDDANLAVSVEVGGPPQAFLALAEVIVALCRSVPCLSAHGFSAAAAHRQAG